MSARGKLDELIQRKQILEARIALRRIECQIAGAQLARPLAFVDRLHDGWARVAPWVKLAGPVVGVFATRRMSRTHFRRGKLGVILSFLPVALNVWKGFNAVRQRRRQEHGYSPMAASAGK